MDKTKTREFTQKSHLQSVAFADGMIVNAADLEDAVRYPVQLFKTLVRAYFGCGIVCGLTLERCDKWGVKVKRGTALDCDGHPLEVCDDWTIDLTPKGCQGPTAPQTLGLAIGRRHGREAHAEGCDCCRSAGAGEIDHRRRESLVVIVYDKDYPPKNLCRLDGPKPEECECLKECPSSCGCRECWVYLGCITLGQDSITKIHGRAYRRYVKPIHCRCDPESDPTGA